MHPGVQDHLDGGGGSAGGLPALGPNGTRKKTCFRQEGAGQEEGVTPSASTENRWARKLKNRTVREWAARICEDERARENRTVQAILPILNRWVNRAHGSLIYRLTQLLTGHDCFGQYLHRIGREPTLRCHHCSAEVDSTEHTVQRCPAWRKESSALERVVGLDLSLPSIAKSMIQAAEKWEAFSTFTEEILTRKEAAEKEREAAARRDPGLRGGPRPQRRRGARRGQQHPSPSQPANAAGSGGGGGRATEITTTT